MDFFFHPHICMHMHKAIFLSHFYTRLKLNSQPHSLMCKHNMYMIRICAHKEARSQKTENLRNRPVHIDLNYINVNAKHKLVCD